MARRPCYNDAMARPERCQLPFDFAKKPDPASIYYELEFAGHEHVESTGRFVRQLREEVVIRSPVDAAHHLLAHVFTPFEAFDQEELWVLMVNNRNCITHEAMIYRGTVNSIHVRPVELFKEAVKVNALALLLSHCHPSGQVEPSPADIQVTEEAVRAGKLLGIEVYDPIIVGRDIWFSLREKGVGFG